MNKYDIFKAILLKPTINYYVWNYIRRKVLNENLNKTKKLNINNELNTYYTNPFANKNDIEKKYNIKYNNILEFNRDNENNV